VKKAVLVIAAALMAMAMLATPVMAIGPFNALQVGKIENLRGSGPSVINGRGGSGGDIYWSVAGSGDHWVRWEFQEPPQAKGLMNNAIIAEYPGPTPEYPNMFAYFAYLSLEEFDNKWIYLAKEGEDVGQWTSPLFGTHGMLYWYIWGMAYMGTSGTSAEKAAAATLAATNFVGDHQDGMFWKHNDIPMH